MLAANNFPPKQMENTAVVKAECKATDSFVGCYLICGQISTDQKAWTGDCIELELLYRVIIDYVSNSTAAH